MTPYGPTEFSVVLKRLRKQSGKSRYFLAQFTGLNEAYLLRLESGERQHLSRDVVVKLGMALMANTSKISMDDVSELLLAADYRPLRGRGEPIPSC